MKENTQFLHKAIENKTITWFKNTNEYLVLENQTADILKRLSKGIPVQKIAEALSKKLAVPLDKTIDFILDLECKIYLPKTTFTQEIVNDYRDVNTPKTFHFIKFYQINCIVFKVCYATEHELSLVHPKFSHLETPALNENHLFIVFQENNFIFLFVDNTLIGAWQKKETHFFQGKFSMQIIQKIHKKEEKEWMGVFHASAVSNGKKAILFLGDSGNGKSTSLALLQANGFSCLADDFVPIDAEKQEVYGFPAAISIKKNSVKPLLPFYPELKKATEYHYKHFNKIVRYLPTSNSNFYTHLPCKELIFIKFKKDAQLICTKISKIKAFEQLIPDSWISPETKNADIFLNWFTNVTCYQLTYSKTTELVAAVSKIFSDES